MSGSSFTKLFSSLTESTLWVEQPHHVRIVWITMLAMADRDGFVAASIPGLARRACVTVEEAEQSLTVFTSPDKYSRTPDHEGRRIAPVSGGWVLLNHRKYRALQSDEAERERKREYMRTKRAEVVPFSPHVPDVPVGGQSSSASASGSASGDLDLRGVQGGSRRGRFAPDDFEPNDTHRVRCQELHLDVAELVKAFKAHEFNREYSDWPRRFAKWIEDEKTKRDTELHRSMRATPTTTWPDGKRKHGSAQPNAGLSGFNWAPKETKE